MNPVGETIRISRQNYEVIGVLASKGTSGIGNQDSVIIMPLRTAQLKLGGAGTTTVSTINLQARSDDDMDIAQAQVTAILRTKHGLAASEDNDFQVQNQEDLLTSVAETSGTFTTLLGSIAAISLLVGGIGIMNIMLVSVTERTREIGLRKAVGAKRGDILVQFLIEAIVIERAGRGGGRSPGRGGRAGDLAAAGRHGSPGHGAERRAGRRRVAGHRRLLRLLSRQPCGRSESHRRTAV